MRKIICIISLLCCSLISFSQNNETNNEDIDYSKYEVQYQPEKRTYFEMGVGGLIPSDDSNSFTCLDLELGSYINDYIGLGLNFKYSSESEYNDELNYIGPKFRYRVNYSPRNTFDMDIYAGLGYGWYRFKDYYYDYDYYDYSYKITETMNYIVPNIGLICYLNVSRNLALGFEPGFMWYISTDLEKSHSVGVWNLQGKIKFTF